MNKEFRTSWLILMTCLVIVSTCEPCISANRRQRPSPSTLAKSRTLSVQLYTGSSPNLCSKI